MTYSIREVIVALTALTGCVLGIYNAIVAYQHTKDKITVNVDIANQGKNSTVWTTPFHFFKAKPLTEIQNKASFSFLSVRIFNKSDFPVDVTQLILTSNKHGETKCIHIFDFSITSATPHLITDNRLISLPLRLERRDFIILNIDRKYLKKAYDLKFGSLEISTAGSAHIVKNVKKHIDILMSAREK